MAKLQRERSEHASPAKVKNTQIGFGVVSRNETPEKIGKGRRAKFEKKDPIASIFMKKRDKKALEKESKQVKAPVPVPNNTAPPKYQKKEKSSLV